MPVGVGVDRRKSGADDGAAADDDDSNDVALPSRQTGHLVGHEGAVLCVEFNATGAYALTGGKDRTVRLWNPARNLLVKSYSGGHASSSDGVRCLAASSDSSRVASGGGGSGGVISVVAGSGAGGGAVVGGGARGDVAWWDVATGAVVRKWHGHDAAVNAVCLFDAAAAGGLSGGGGGGGGSNTTTSLVVSASDDATARAWDPRSRSSNPVQVLRGARDSLTGVGIGNNNNRNKSSNPVIVTSSVDGKVRSYDPRSAELAVDDVGSAVAAMRLGSSSSASTSAKSNQSNSNDLALVSCLDGRLRVLDLRSGSRLAELSGHDAFRGVRTDCRLFSSSPSSCSSSLSSSSSSYSKSSSSSSSLSLYAACGSEDGRVCAWSVESEEMVASVSIHGSSGSSGSGGARSSLPPPPPPPPSTFTRNTSSSSCSYGPVTALAIRPGDAGMLLAAGTDGRVRVFQRRGRS